MKVVLSPNPYRDRGLKTALRAREVLNRCGIETALCLPFSLDQGTKPDLPKGQDYRDMQEELKTADLLLCFGGDGTILHAAKDALPYDIPVLGVNMGSVGFMAELEHGELELLTRLAEKKYTIEHRMLLDVAVRRGREVLFRDLALNDAVVTKGAVARVIDLSVRGGRSPRLRVLGGRGHRGHPHRLHRLLHVGGGAHRGAHLPLHHRHAGVRP